MIDSTSRETMADTDAPCAAPSALKQYDQDWERRAAGADRHPTGNLRVDLVFERIQSGRRLLDIGCGEGQMVAVTRDKVTFRVGIDGAEAAVRRARRHGPVVLADLDGRVLPFRNGGFDLITCLDVLEHLRDPRLMMAELARLLSPDGVLFLSIPNARYIIRIKELALGRFPVVTDGGPLYDAGHLHSFAARNIGELAAAAGLHLDESIGYESQGPRRWKRHLLAAILPKRLRRELLSIGLVFKMRRRV